jgi:hypothetical protein
MIDKDLQNVELIDECFDGPTKLLCTFHVIKYLRSCIAREEINAVSKNRLLNIVREIIFLEDIELLDLKLHELKEFDSFYRFFDKNWLNCKEMWMCFYRRTLNTRNTNTNNHIESFNRAIKRRLNSKLHISECLEQLMRLTSEFQSDIIRTTFCLKKKRYHGNEPWISELAPELTNFCIRLIEEENKFLLSFEKGYSINKVSDCEVVLRGNTESSKEHILKLENNLWSCDCDQF